MCIRDSTADAPAVAFPIDAQFGIAAVPGVWSGKDLLRPVAESADELSLIHIYIMEALKKSLEMRKPPAVAETISAEEPARASARSRRPAVRKAGGA